MRVDDWMSRNVMTVSPETTLGEAEELMKKHRIRHLPVVETGRLVGLVSQRDLLRASIDGLSGPAPKGISDLRRSVALRRLMVTNVVTLPPGSELAEAAKILWDRKLGCVPIVDDDGDVTGILTEADFVRLYLSA